MSEVRLVVDCRNVLGEGLTWDPSERRLYWVDIESCEIWSLDPATGQTSSQKASERVACLAPRPRGGLIVAFASGLALYDPATRERKNLAAFEPDNPNTRLNDGRTDRQGRLVAGGFDEMEGKFVSSVVRIDQDYRVTTLLRRIACANGICFSADGRTMYFADSPARTIWAYDYDDRTGAVSNRRVLNRFEDQPGLPDGSCIDAEGFIWNAQWNGRRVVRFAPDGRIDRIVPVPVLNPTCVTFGGEDLDTLYITTARYLMTPEQIAAEPQSGALFAIKPGVRGVPDKPFLG
ncbi:MULTISPECIES: SMP-30/gluconolactonase/LRE family protein [unclassified Bradyrhizobium]|uniref:SMP-30/gluconolactonase/LRE family protein n=1 Tax=unclassified Bradyrhizobium TaxID=2631580 RepID=UPI0024799A77|nr:MULTISPECIES: SMP-30/gluconolactonase/LRE family protein [unclassified Bradyrhizobium]WGS17389.1 SMP-30/gluconolactonase/LRE family protein [Bradyrhizobium sp. ISRA463]WGS24159.1 SMP-30/gluconolactonase/LRE family protein [Bradyrhizobium sp. ISRA464]